VQGPKLTVPVGDVLVGDARGDIEHDDTALAVDVVAVTETTKLLLTCSVPDIELDLTEVLWFTSLSAGGCARHGMTGGRETYGGEAERVNFDTQSGNVLLLKLSGQVTLDKGSLCIAQEKLVKGRSQR
jgi:hypothetical protein